MISCSTVAEELSRLGVPEERLKVLDFGLHMDADRLRESVQAEIDAVAGDCDILLGYGLCSNGVVGLKSDTHRLVIPRCDDCIALFLGSREEHLDRLKTAPGTYYLTKGWVEAQSGPIEEYARIHERYGEARAKRLVGALFGNYTHIALINTGNYRMDFYREFAKAMALFLGLEFVEVPGSNRLLKKLLSGDWDSEFAVVETGTPVSLEMFQK